MSDFHREFIRPGDPIVASGIFGCVVDYASAGTVAVVLAERGGMPGKVYSMSESDAETLRDALYQHHG